MLHIAHDSCRTTLLLVYRRQAPKCVIILDEMNESISLLLVRDSKVRVKPAVDMGLVELSLCFFFVSRLLHDLWISFHEGNPSLILIKVVADVVQEEPLLFREEFLLLLGRYFLFRIFFSLGFGLLSFLGVLVHFRILILLLSNKLIFLIFWLLFLFIILIKRERVLYHIPTY